MPRLPQPGASVAEARRGRKGQKRTRSVTADRNAYLLTWDDWQSKANGGTGHYAVSVKTYRSLRIYFNLD